MPFTADRLRSLLAHRATGVAWLVADVRNLVVNPSFENGIVGWTYAGTAPTPAAYAGWAVAGASSARITTASDVSGNYLAQFGLPVTAGLTYTLRAAINVLAVTGAGNAYGYVNWKNAAGGVVSSSDAVAMRTTVGITNQGINIVAPAGAVAADLYIYFKGTGALGSIDAAVDAVFFGAGAALAYFDGATPSSPTERYHWLGATHASGSRHITVNLDGENDALLDALCTALGAGIERLALVGYGDPLAGIDGGRVLRDTRVAPLWALAHAAMYMGAQLPGRMAAETEAAYLLRAREAVVYPFGIRRGTHEAIRRAVQPFLTGTKSVFIQDAFGANEYSLFVRTITSETPDPAAVQRVIEGSYVSGGAQGAIRAELVLTYSASDSPVWQEATRTWATVAAGVEWSTVTRGDVT